MVEIASCPRCAAQLAAPPGREPNCSAKCPICDAEFSLENVRIRHLPELVIVHAESVPAVAEARSASRTVPMSSLWSQEEDEDESVAKPQESTRDRTAAPTVRSDSPSLAALFEQYRDVPPPEHAGEPFVEDESEALGDSPEHDAPEEGEAASPLANADEPSQNLLQDEQYSKRTEPFNPGDWQDEEGEPSLDSDPLQESPADALGAGNGLEPVAAEEPGTMGTDPDADLSPRAAAPQFADSADDDLSFRAPIKRSRQRGGRKALIQFGGIAVFGLLGLGMGYLVILHLQGPRGDFLAIAQHVPSILLPSSFGGAANQSTGGDPRFAADGAERGDSSGAIRATYETPAYESTPAEPAAFGASDATAIDVSPLRGVDRTSAQDLLASTTSAESALSVLSQGSFDTAESRLAMGKAYKELGQVAKNLALADADSSDSTMQLRKFEARDLFARLFEAPTGDSIRLISAKWLSWDNRPHDGVFFAGSPIPVTQHDGLYEYRFQMPDGGEAPVVSDTPLESATGVIGVVLRLPTEQLEGYQGDSPWVVWAGATVPLAGEEP